MPSIFDFIFNPAGAAFDAGKSLFNADDSNSSGISDYLFGKPAELKQFYNLSPEQQKAQNVLLGGGIQNSPLYQQGGNYISQLLDGSSDAFSKFEAPYLRQFNEQIVPELAARFGNLGTGGSAMRGNNFGHALGGAAQRLSESLASMRSGMQMNALPQALGYAQQPFNNMQAGLSRNNYTPYIQEGQQGFVPGFLGGAGAGAGNALITALMSLL